MLCSREFEANFQAILCRVSQIQILLSSLFFSRKGDSCSLIIFSLRCFMNDIFCLCSLHLPLQFILVWQFSTWDRLHSCPKTLPLFQTAFMTRYLVSFVISDLSSNIQLFYLSSSKIQRLNFSVQIQYSGLCLLLLLLQPLLGVKLLLQQLSQQSNSAMLLDVSHESKLYTLLDISMGRSTSQK